jgi:nitrogen fixation/metabolism regulation signal transduction histidine kinase
LTIVRKIVTDHGGEISVRNLDAGGVEFKILLPFPG